MNRVTTHIILRLLKSNYSKPYLSEIDIQPDRYMGGCAEI